MTANPTLLSMPLAQNGQKNVIPETQATAGDGLFSQSTGFPAETSLPLGAGGVAPSREDFNGMANLLGGVAYYAQKGFTFNYDATQDYYTGCVVIDQNDGNRYMCIADMAAGTIAPSADTTGTYWTIFPFGLINKRDVITTSVSYTAPVTGWYKITVKGGGGGGQGGGYNSNWNFGGTGGGEGGTSVAFEKMTAGDTASVVIGAGGAGGAVNSNNVGYAGSAGGNSTVTVNSHTYTGGGGSGGNNGTRGGTGNYIIGGAGSVGVRFPSASPTYLAGGGIGGGTGIDPRNEGGLNSGFGGIGGNGQQTSSTAGTQGADGFAAFEYFDSSLT